VHARVEGVVGADRERLDLRPLAGRELRLPTFDAPDEERRVLDVEIAPLRADARGPAAVGRAVDALVKHGDGARVLDRLAAVPEAAFAVEAQAARFAELLEQGRVHARIVMKCREARAKVEACSNDAFSTPWLRTTS